MSKGFKLHISKPFFFFTKLVETEEDQNHKKIVMQDFWPLLHFGSSFKELLVIISSCIR